MNRQISAVVLAVVATVGVVAGCQSAGGSNSGSGPGGGGTLPTDSPGTKPAPKTTNGKPAETEDKGYAWLTRVEDGPVSCDSVDSEISFEAREGGTRWTAKAQRGEGIHDNTRADGITVRPSSGTLKQGQSATIRVTGDFDKRNKVFYVSVVSRNGSTGYAAAFKCR
jgi:hypothetical protein